MRLWHYKLLPYLPDLQFKGQLRELVAIMHDWRDKATTNHLLINKVMEYDKKHLTSYFLRYDNEYRKRYHKNLNPSVLRDFIDFSNYIEGKDVFCSATKKDIISIRLVKNQFDGWHNKEYLRVCMANLYEKHFFGVGKSRITDEEWQRLLDGYKAITGEEYQI